MGVKEGQHRRVLWVADGGTGCRSYEIGEGGKWKVGEGGDRERRRVCEKQKKEKVHLFQKET